jgi:hypothetical protein
MYATFAIRMELALTWLYEEWYHDEIMRQAIPDYVRHCRFVKVV